MIACLGWGSLCWDPRSLPISGEWQVDGPHLPVEFSRVSSDGRVTLALTEGAMPLPVLWVPLSVTSMDDAIEALAEREGVRSRAAIGRAPDEGYRFSHGEPIERWAAAKGIEAVVWTGLKPGLNESSRGVIPSLEQLLRHVFFLTPEQALRALEYVERAPPQIATRRRDALRSALCARIPPEGRNEG